ncbi:MAG TPA: ferrochelatase [Gammaproteobacteria bacterium]
MALVPGPRYTGDNGFRHDTPERLGVLIVNLGTPDAPTPSAVRRYLRQFLSDPRVIELPHLARWLLVRAILLTRSRRSARAYRKVWREDGSPLLHFSRRQAGALWQELGRRCPGPVSVALGMRYGNPSIPAAMESLRRENVRRLLVLPLYPQYSATTTASVFDAVAAVLERSRWLPELRFVNHYHDHEGYNRALADSIRDHWKSNGRGETLLFSFHGLPERYLRAGDPYHCECHKTARLVAEMLDLRSNEYLVTFQSRVGREKWLQPYTADTVASLARDGVKTVDVICPGFSTDCLETLEEIVLQNGEIFRASGGASLRYIPALNDRDDHIRFLADLVMKHLQGWPEASPAWSKHKARESTERARLLADRMREKQGE